MRLKSEFAQELFRQSSPSTALRQLQRAIKGCPALRAALRKNGFPLGEKSHYYTEQECFLIEKYFGQMPSSNDM